MHANGNSMSTKAGSAKKRQTVPDYDFSNGVRGKYAARFAAGTNIVVLSPDVAEVFQDSEAVNDALRTLVRMSAKKDGSRNTQKESTGKLANTEIRAYRSTHIDSRLRRDDYMARKIRGDARVGTVEKRLGLKPGTIRNPDGSDARSDKRVDTLRKQQRKK